MANAIGGWPNSIVYKRYPDVPATVCVLVGVIGRLKIGPGISYTLVGREAGEVAEVNGPNCPVDQRLYIAVWSKVDGVVW